MEKGKPKDHSDVPKNMYHTNVVKIRQRNREFAELQAASLSPNNLPAFRYILHYFSRHIVWFIVTRI